MIFSHQKCHYTDSNRQKSALNLGVVIKLPDWVLHSRGTTGLYFIHFIIFLLDVVEIYPISSVIHNLLYYSFIRQKYM